MYKVIKANISTLSIVRESIKIKDVQLWLLFVYWFNLGGFLCLIWSETLYRQGTKKMDMRWARCSRGWIHEHMWYESRGGGFWGERVNLELRKENRKRRGNLLLCELIKKGKFLNTYFEVFDIWNMIQNNEHHYLEIGKRINETTLDNKLIPVKAEKWYTRIHGLRLNIF